MIAALGILFFVGYCLVGMTFSLPPRPHTYIAAGFLVGGLIIEVVLTWV